MNDKLQTMYQYVTLWNAEEKERLFWHLADLLSKQNGNWVMLFSIFEKEQIEKRFNLKLTDDQYKYLTENFMDFNTFVCDHIGWLIEEAIYLAIC